MNKVPRRFRILFVSAALLGGVQGLMAASAGPAELRGTFSDICVQPQTGDLLGTEVSFIPTPDGGVVLFQRAEGVLLKPVLLASRMSEPKRAEARGQSGVAFVVELKTPDELVLQFKDGQVNRDGTAVATLQRRLPAWSGQQKPPVCR